MSDGILVTWTLDSDVRDSFDSEKLFVIKCDVGGGEYDDDLDELYDTDSFLLFANSFISISTNLLLVFVVKWAEFGLFSCLLVVYIDISRLF